MPANVLGPEQWERFLNRPPLTPDRALTSASLAGKRVLITGAGGSIGSALTRAVAEIAPEQILLLEASEQNLYHAENGLIYPHLVSFLGSAGDAILLNEIFSRHRPHIVFHAAAFKHVPLLERNPFAAIQNNSLATDLLYRAAAEYGAEQLILLSTDKAVDPASMMGASKRIAELTLLAGHSSSLQAKVVRLGNVLGSEGSIVPLFLQQIAAGTALTITHRQMRRYFLSPADAVTLLLSAASSAAPPGVLVPDLGQSLSVEALARYLLAYTDAHNPIVFTQPRAGDKMCEALLSSRETYRIDTQGPGLLHAVDSPAMAATPLRRILLELQSACDERSLEKLLAAVLRAVPEYQPSALVRPGKASCEEFA